MELGEMDNSLMDAAGVNSTGKKVSISVPTGCFCMLFLIWCLGKIYLFNRPPFTQVFDILQWPLYLMGFFSGFLRARFRVKELVITVLVATVFMITYFLTGSAELFKAVLLAVVMCRENYRKTIKLTYLIYIFSIIFTISLYLLGLSDAGQQRRNSISLGYIQANAVGFVCMMLAIYAFQRSPINTWMVKGRLIAVTVVGFILSDSRTGCLLALLVVVFSNLRVYTWIHRHKSIQLMLALLPCFCFVFSIGTAMMYTTNARSQILNSLLGGRIWMNYYMLNKYGVSLFGQNFYLGGSQLIENPVTHGLSSYMTIDCAYVYLLIQMGIVASVLICVLYFFLVKKLVKNQAYSIIIATSAILLYGITESSIVSVYVFLPFLLLLNKHPNSWDNLRVVIPQQ